MTSILHRPHPPPHLSKIARPIQTLLLLFISFVTLNCLWSPKSSPTHQFCCWRILCVDRVKLIKIITCMKIVSIHIVVTPIYIQFFFFLFWPRSERNEKNYSEFKWFQCFRFSITNLFLFARIAVRSNKTIVIIHNLVDLNLKCLYAKSVVTRCTLHSAHSSFKWEHLSLSVAYCERLSLDSI